MVEQRTENPRVVGSIPTGGTNADLAHLVERRLAKAKVAGSSPVIRSKKRSLHLAQTKTHDKYLSKPAFAVLKEVRAGFDRDFDRNSKEEILTNFILCVFLVAFSVSVVQSTPTKRRPRLLHLNPTARLVE